METVKNLRAELRAAIVAEDSEGVLGRVDQILFKDEGILILAESRESEDLRSPANVTSTEKKKFDDVHLNMEQNLFPGSKTSVLNSSEEEKLDSASCFAVEVEDIPHDLAEKGELNALKTLDTNITFDKDGPLLPKAGFSDKVVADEASCMIDRNRGLSSIEEMENNEDNRVKTDHVLQEESSLPPNSTRQGESESQNTEDSTSMHNSAEDDVLKVLNATDGNMMLTEDENVLPECFLDSSKVAEFESAVSSPGGAISLQENVASTKKEKIKALNMKETDPVLNKDVETLVLSKPKTGNGSAEDTLDSAGNQRNRGKPTAGEFLH